MYRLQSILIPSLIVGEFHSIQRDKSRKVVAYFWDFLSYQQVHIIIFYLSIMYCSIISKFYPIAVTQSNFDQWQLNQYLEVSDTKTMYNTFLWKYWVVERVQSNELQYFLSSNWSKVTFSVVAQQQISKYVISWPILGLFQICRHIFLEKCMINNNFIMLFWGIGVPKKIHGKTGSILQILCQSTHSSVGTQLFASVLVVFCRPIFISQMTANWILDTSCILESKPGGGLFGV